MSAIYENKDEDGFLTPSAVLSGAFTPPGYLLLVDQRQESQDSDILDMINFSGLPR
uniref:Uncharacterized protein n=1 Tax=Arundo donax TaxID=35708 RepID=A0A0A9BJ77_ARUDO